MPCFYIKTGFRGAAPQTAADLRIMPPFTGRSAADFHAARGTTFKTPPDSIYLQQNFAPKI